MNIAPSGDGPVRIQHFRHSSSIFLGGVAPAICSPSMCHERVYFRVCAFSGCYWPSGAKPRAVSVKGRDPLVLKTPVHGVKHGTNRSPALHLVPFVFLFTLDINGNVSSRYLGYQSATTDTSNRRKAIPPKYFKKKPNRATLPLGGINFTATTDTSTWRNLLQLLLQAEPTGTRKKPLTWSLHVFFRSFSLNWWDDRIDNTKKKFGLFSHDHEPGRILTYDQPRMGLEN